MILSLRVLIQRHAQPAAPTRINGSRVYELHLDYRNQRIDRSQASPPSYLVLSLESYESVNDFYFCVVGFSANDLNRLASVIEVPQLC